jgi:membrane protein DedA with SNARE-associated domain
LLDLFSSLIGLIESVPGWLRNLLAGLAIMLETSIFVGLIMPGDTVVLVASTGVSHWSDFFFLLMAVLIGSLIGETIGFAIGRFLPIHGHSHWQTQGLRFRIHNQLAHLDSLRVIEINLRLQEKWLYYMLLLQKRFCNSFSNANFTRS